MRLSNQLHIFSIKQTAHLPIIDSSVKSAHVDIPTRGVLCNATAVAPFTVCSTPELSVKPCTPLYGAGRSFVNQGTLPFASLKLSKRSFNVIDWLFPTSLRTTLFRSCDNYSNKAYSNRNTQPSPSTQNSFHRLQCRNRPSKYLNHLLCLIKTHLSWRTREHGGASKFIRVAFSIRTCF